ncbi:MAG: autotransporter outer membrane beta-barrel domain-containing protein [Proteobacteria bacterium]|nr:autotransporter outer membrane beta-barrel domain-containing protein [Pseudomonadota bacterium]
MSQVAKPWSTGASLRGLYRLVPLGLFLTLSYTNGAYADLANLEGQFSNEVEESSARGTQASYDALLLENGGPCDVRQSGPSSGCSGSVFTVFQSAREFVQTGNELTGDGPVQYSLGVDLSGLGRALRWNAGEEFSGQGSQTSEFVDGQLSGLASRITALRFGASGFFIAGLPVGDAQMATAPGARGETYGMGASADYDFVKSWGGFINASYGYGDKEATGNEDAFDFDGYDITAGIDYRINNQWVVGGVLGYTDREIDFEQIGNIVVDGGIETDGFSILPFVLYQGNRFFGSISLGYQSMSFDSDRAIKYASLNPDVESTNTRTLSSSDSDTLTFSAAGGYGFDFGQFHFEPYISVEYLDITIDAFTERDINGDGKDFEVDDQDIESLEGTLGVKFVYTFLPSFGVISPYIDLEFHKQFENDARTIEAVFHGSSAAVDTSTARFKIDTDELDERYYVIAVGASAVLPGGFQGYLTYRTIEGLDFYTHSVISGGVRYEF